MNSQSDEVLHEGHGRLGKKRLLLQESPVPHLAARAAAGLQRLQHHVTNLQKA